VRKDFELTARVLFRDIITTTSCKDQGVSKWVPPENNSRALLLQYEMAPYNFLSCSSETLHGSFQKIKSNSMPIILQTTKD
jgi:hypothetical protein